ncbi:hypothetical protein OKJ48_22480 [Streptomyces kunmingensis]|uniref:Uncharacterized protein n=1 Tax=Streptomyces kunmingensis TaxID=68225 RepID=A0ABU6CE59_9ACTN|nr:hypothetical protein [Streptomyces kunmingensis]MEB3962992.1 hypothetical protein [Streptomyces kunmingensis]
MNRRSVLARGRLGTAGRRSETGSTGALTLSGGDGVFIVHRTGTPHAFPADIIASLRTEPAEGTTVLVDTLVTDGELDAFTAVLDQIRDPLRHAGTSEIRLAMSAGAKARAERPAPAQTLSAAWGVDVVAPSGAAVIVPGGSLFSPDDPDAPGGWWRFSPGLVPRRLGARWPTPDWDAALDRVNEDIAENHFVQQIPAGLLMHPKETRSEGIDALRYAVPADPAHPVLLVGSPGSPPVDADALAGVITALPRHIRGTLRLLPGDGRDLLDTGQEVADALGLEVQVGSGLPVVVTADSPDSPAHRVLIFDANGTASWRPYVQTVTCAPAESGPPPAPRLGSWRLPEIGSAESSEPGVLVLDKRWQVTLTRAGMWIGPRGKPVSMSERRIDTAVVAIDLGVSGRSLDDSLWPMLDQLFGGLEQDVRDRAMIQVHGTTSAEGLRMLRRLAVRHGLVLAPNGWRSDTQDTVVTPSAPAAGIRLEQPAEAASSEPPAAPPSPAAPASVDIPATDPTPSAPPVLPSSNFDITMSTSSAGTVDASSWQTPHPFSGPQESIYRAPAGLPPTPAVAESGASAQVSTTTASASPQLGRPPASPPSGNSRGAGAEHDPLSHDDDDHGTEHGTEHGKAYQSPSPGGVPTVPDAAHVTETSPHHTLPETPPTEAPTPEPTSSQTDLSGSTPPPAPSTPMTYREILYAPIRPTHVSSAAQRKALREHLGSHWDRHLGAVQRTLTRLPGLRIGHAVDELAEDLTAVHAYLEGDMGLSTDAGLERRDPGTLAFLSCLASGLRCLPSYRGTAIRSGGMLGEGADLLLPGEELGEATAISALALAGGYVPVPQDHYLIASVTGRRTGSLTGEEQAASAEEIVFGPATRLRVLAVRERAGSKVILLREIMDSAPISIPGVLDDTDQQVLNRLNAFADQPSTAVPGLTFPSRCAGALGLLSPDTSSA